jgi:two-component system cell cycle response regulator
MATRTGNSREAQKSRTLTLAKSDVIAKSTAKLPPCILLVSGSEADIGRQWPLDKSELIVGRAASSDIRIDASGLSKEHARFILDGEGVSIVDLGSRNKTIVNGRELAPFQPCILTNEDQIKTGGIVFRFLQRNTVQNEAA